MSNPKSTKSTCKVNRHIGSKIREGRHATGISQVALAARLGISYQQLQKYETGANRISASRIAKIARILNEPITYFYDGAPGITAKALASPEDRSIYKELLQQEDTAELAKAFSRIPDTTRRLLALEIVKEFAKTTSKSEA